MSNLPLCNSNQEALSGFDTMPNAAFVRAPVVAALRGCSVNTVWRHSKQGLIPKPRKIGPQVTAWNVGELRAAMQEVA
jgi:predicted DNA-binding transcriptional regulator AlpA